ncbi:MAG: hypothetical protein ABI895_10295 [Deltaproteobacteria bacterium]
MSKNQTLYRITGLVIDRAAGKPAAGVTVRAFDEDVLREQHLGEAITGAAGEYEIIFTRAAFSGPLLRLEQPPDVLVRVYDRRGRLLASTEDKVLLDAGRDSRIDVSVRLPQSDEVSVIGGQFVNLAAAAQLSTKELRGLYAHLRQRTRELPRADLIRLAFPGIFTRRAPGDDCGEGSFEAVRALLKERGDFDTADLDDFPVGETVHTFFTARILVRYTTDAGANQVNATVPAADAGVALSDGTVIGTVRANLVNLHPSNTEVAPTYVQQVGIIAEHALARFLAWGFRDPRNGAVRMEYRILAQAAGVFGQTSGSWSHVEVGPSNSTLQNLHTASHELFHQVQYRYNATTTRSGIYGALREGGARLIEDSINDTPNRYVDTAQLIFSTPAESLVDFPVGTSTPIRYAAGLFWKYLAEQHSTQTAAANEPAIGIDSYRRVLEATANVLGTDPGLGYDPAALRTARAGLPWYGSFDQFRYYDAAATQLDSHETTWSNYLVANFLHGTANPVLERRFEYMEDEDAVSWPGSAVAKLAALQSLVQASDALVLSQGSNISRSIVAQKAYSARYFRLTKAGPAPRMVRINFSASAAMTDPLVQVLRLGAGSALLDLHRSDRSTYSKTIDLSGLSEVVVIVSARMNPGDYSIQFEELATASDVMVTRWNTRVGKEYEIDPRGWAWTWTSPDVMVDTDDDGLADSQVFFGVNNKLKLRLRNRGNAAANNIQVEFWYQKATPFLTAAGWLPVQDTALTTQTVTGESLAAAGQAGSEKWVSVDWAPVNDGTNHEHWCVRALVTAVGDLNIDNKMVLSNFSSVVPDPDSDIRQLLRHPVGARSHRLDVIPRGRWTLRLLERRGDPLPELAEPPPQCACSSERPSYPLQTTFLNMRAAPLEAQPWDGRATLAPAPGIAYPTPKDALPPGVDPDSLVTVAHVVDGQVAGGISYRVLADFVRR